LEADTEIRKANDNNATSPEVRIGSALLVGRRRLADHFKPVAAPGSGNLLTAGNLTLHQFKAHRPAALESTR